MTSADDHSLTAEDLLASPRGRSFVFDLAHQPPVGDERHFDEELEPLTPEARDFDELNKAIFLAAYLADKERGIPVAMYHGPGTRELPPGFVTSADIALLLRHRTPVTPNADTVRGAIGNIVDEAKYWEPRSSGDIIVDDTAVTEALMPAARTIIGTGLLKSWSEPLDPKAQWALAWDNSDLMDWPPAVFGLPLEADSDFAAITLDDLSGTVDSPASLMPHGLESWLADSLTEETEYRADFAKNPWNATSGRWWSTPPFGLWSSTGIWCDGTPVGLELVEDSFGFERARACRVQIREDARIAEINRPEDWAGLCRRYPLDVTAQHRSDWFETTGRKGRWVIPDWSQVAEEFDGVHVSLAGYLRIAGAVVDVGEGDLVDDSPSLPTLGNTDERTASLMAGWDPDTTYWLNDVITGVAEVVEWVVGDDIGEWVRA